jgi:hypothetical protein
MRIIGSTHPPNGRIAVCRTRLATCRVIALGIELSPNPAHRKIHQSLQREKLDIGNQATVNPQCQVISHTDIATILRSNLYALALAVPLTSP